mgnify:CR=1 FL=1
MILSCFFFSLPDFLVLTLATPPVTYIKKTQINSNIAIRSCVESDKILIEIFSQPNAKNYRPSFFSCRKKDQRKNRGTFICENSSNFMKMLQLQLIKLNFHSFKEIKLKITLSCHFLLISVCQLS